MWPAHAWRRLLLQVARESCRDGHESWQYTGLDPGWRNPRVVEHLILVPGCGGKVRGDSRHPFPYRPSHPRLRAGRSPSIDLTTNPEPDRRAMSQGLEHHLVTGAAGFIGSHLVEHLLARGDRVTGIDNFDPFYSPEEKRRNLASAQENSNFGLIELDCADLEGLEEALGDQVPDTIVHLAAKAGVRPSIADPLGYAHANLTGTQSMLELARRREIKRFIFASSSSVYGNNEKVPFAEDDPVEHPISPYAATKRSGELLCHTYHHLFGMSVISLRFFTVYGPRQRPDLAIRKFSEHLRRGEPIPFFGDGTTERDYPWIDDSIQGVLAAIDRTGKVPNEYQTINLGESETTTLSELVELIGKALGVEPELKRLPMQPGDVRRTYADVTRAAELLGYRPTTPVEIGIPRFVEWLEENVGSGVGG